MKHVCPYCMSDWNYRIRITSARSLTLVRRKNNCLTASQDIPNYDCLHWGVVTRLFSPFKKVAFEYRKKRGTALQSKINSWVVSFKDFDTLNKVVFPKHRLFFMHYYPNAFPCSQNHTVFLPSGLEEPSKTSQGTAQAWDNHKCWPVFSLSAWLLGRPLPLAASSRHASSCICNSCR